MTFSCHLLFQSVATVAAQGGKRKGSLSDISQPWIWTVWLLSATEVSTDGAVHCCLSCHPVLFTICNAYMSRERFLFHAKRCVILYNKVVVSQHIPWVAELNSCQLQLMERMKWKFWQHERFNVLLSIINYERDHHSARVRPWQTCCGLV